MTQPSIADVSEATIRMLEWRGVQWDPKDEEWGQQALFQLLRSPSPCPTLFHVASERTLIVISDAMRIGTQHIKSLLDATTHYDLGHIELLTRQSTATHIQGIPVSGRISLLPWFVVLMYPLDHKLVPHHRRATAEDLAELPPGSLTRASTQLPILRQEDPIARYLALRVGDIVRIERLDNTVYFRLVAP